jgi:hypothetical protein
MPSRESSLRNLAKAQAKWRAPRPWRSYQETCVIKRLVWQWFNYPGPQKWTGRTVGRRLGVSHTYVQKLVREFAMEPSKMLRGNWRCEATLDDLSRAQEQSRKERERGWLRTRRLWKVAEFKIGDDVVRAIVPTKAAQQESDLELFNGRAHEGTRITYMKDAVDVCDPLIAVKHAMLLDRQKKTLRPIRIKRRFPYSRW